MHERRDRYAVVFRENNGPTAAGRLEVIDDRLLLCGGNALQRSELSVPLSEISDIRIGRERAERLNGYPTIVLERQTASPLQVAPLGASLLHEIADLLTGLTVGRDDESDELAVVVPLKPGCLGRIRELLASGPPVDPASLGLTAHQVYLREDAAVFLFSGPRVREQVRQAMRSPALWRAGMAWRRCIAGRPEIHNTQQTPTSESELTYSWAADHIAR